MVLITNLLSVLCVSVEVLSCAHAKFGTFIGRFPSDGRASMAVKGLSDVRSPRLQHMGKKPSSKIFYTKIRGLFINGVRSPHL